MSIYSRPEISDIESQGSLEIILKRIANSSTVLEFGAATGVMTRYLKNKLNCKVYVVELDGDMESLLSKSSERVLIGDIEKILWEEAFQDIKFDYVIFADVLEHLYDPYAVLSRVKKILNPDGKILFSIPNIAHNAIIMNLLLDKFEYQKLGILDNTHIRFFTKNSLDKMVVDCGYKPLYVTGTFALPYNSEFKIEYSIFKYSIINTLLKRKYGHVYQFIYEVGNIDYADAKLVENFDSQNPNIVNQIKLIMRAYFNTLFLNLKKIHEFLFKYTN